MLGELRQSLAERELTFTWDDSVVEYLTKKAYSVANGARNLRRTIQKDIEDPVSEVIIASFVHPITRIAVSAAEDKIVLTTE